MKINTNLPQQPKTRRVRFSSNTSALFESLVFQKNFNPISLPESTDFLKETNPTFLPKEFFMFFFIFDDIKQQFISNPEKFWASLADAAPKKTDSLSGEGRSKIIWAYVDQNGVPEY